MVRDWWSLLWYLFVIAVLSPIVADVLKNFGLGWPYREVGTFLVAIVLIFAEMLLVDSSFFTRRCRKLLDQIATLQDTQKF